MHVKVELSRTVRWDLQHRFAADADSFYKQLRLIERDPLAHSELFWDAGLRSYALRFFAFGRGVEKIAIFAYYPAPGLIRVIECRLSEPRRLRDVAPEEDEPGP